MNSMDKLKTDRERVLRSDVVKYWYQNKPECGKYFIDIGEANCWACGKPVSVRFDIKKRSATDEECFNIWDKVGHLQVCHIVPKALGGSDEPSNLFLMCKECHELAPDTPYPDIFFKWVDGQDHIKRIVDRVNKTLELYNIDEEQFCRYFICSSEKTPDQEDFRKFCVKKIGLHRSIYGGAKIKESTYIGLLYEFLQLKNNERGEKGSD